MRLALAQHFGGGPAYWGLPDPADEATVSTAMDMILERDRKRRTHHE